MPKQTSDILDIAGLTALAVAAFATDWRLGVALIGLLLLLSSYLMTRGGGDQ